MSRLRLNTSLTLGLILSALLLVTLVVPFVMDLPDPMDLKMTMEVDGALKKPPYAPGVGGYLLGSDQGGRDLFARIIYGARSTLLLGVTVAVGRTLLAIPLGLLSGWYRGLFGRAVAAVSTGMGALPTLVLTTFILWSVQRVVRADWLLLYGGVILLVGLPRLAEQVRLLTEETLTMPHVEAAVAVGATPLRILRKHVLPIIRGDILVSVAAETAWVLMIIGQLAIFNIFASGMTSIQVGERWIILDGQPEWGLMLGANRDLIRGQHWWVPVFPAIALGLTVACFQLLAEGVRVRWLRR